MVSKELREQWDEFKNAVKQQWSKVTDEDLAKFDATLTAFASMLQERYGITRDSACGEVQGFLARLHEDLKSTAAHLRESAHDTWDRTRDRVRDGGQAVRDRVEALLTEQRAKLDQRSRRVREFVHDRPMGSLAVAAGAGALLALLLRRK